MKGIPKGLKYPKMLEIEADPFLSRRFRNASIPPALATLSL
jgi:hypothetical protein